MRIAIYCFDYGATSITGAGIYYEQLASILMQHGHFVDAYCMRSVMIDNSQAVTVYPWRFQEQLKKYDLILCSPDLQQKASKFKVPFIAILQRELQPVPVPGLKGIIYCAEHLREKYPIRGKAMVWRPMCRLKEKTEPREFKKVVGAVNLSHSKGGKDVIDLARKYPTWEFHVIHRGMRISRPPDNMIIFEWNNDPAHMQSFYDRVSLMYLPYTSEGYNTVALEATSQHIPVMGSSIDGLIEVVRQLCHSNLLRYDATSYQQATNRAKNRWQEIKELNNPYQLLNFIE